VAAVSIGAVGGYYQGSQGLYRGFVRAADGHTITINIEGGANIDAWEHLQTGNALAWGSQAGCGGPFWAVFGHWTRRNSSNISLIYRPPSA